MPYVNATIPVPILLGVIVLIAIVYGIAKGIREWI
jgi:hypothetical protein